MRRRPRLVATRVKVADLEPEPEETGAARTDRIEKEWREQAEGFDLYRRDQGRAARTRELDGFQLARLTAWAVHGGHALSDFEEEQAATFIRELDPVLSPRGVNMALQASCLFGDYLTTEQVWQHNPFRSRRLHKRREIKSRLPRGLTTEELGALLAAPDRKTAHGLRDYLCIYLAAFTGLRAGELCNLREEDVDGRACRVRVRGETAKTRTERWPWLPHRRDSRGERHLLPELEAPLRDWLKVRSQFGVGPSDPLFVGVSRNPLHNEQGAAINRDTLRQAIERYAKRAGISRTVGPHRLRHTAGYLMARGGVMGRPMGVDEIRQQLGHCSITMALHYSQASAEDVGNSYEQTRLTESVHVPTRERARVVSPTTIQQMEERIRELERANNV